MRAAIAPAEDPIATTCSEPVRRSASIAAAMSRSTRSPDLDVYASTLYPPAASSRAYGSHSQKSPFEPCASTIPRGPLPSTTPRRCLSMAKKRSAADRSDRDAQPSRTGSGRASVERLVVDHVAAKPWLWIAHRRPEMPRSRETDGAEPARVDAQPLRVRAHVRDRGLDVTSGGCSATAAGRRSGCRTRSRSGRSRRSAAPSRSSGRCSGRGRADRRGGRPAGDHERFAVGRRPSAEAATSSRRCSGALWPGACPRSGGRRPSRASGSDIRPRPGRRRARRRGSRARLSRALLQLEEDLVGPADPRLGLLDAPAERSVAEVGRILVTDAFLDLAVLGQARRRPPALSLEVRDQGGATHVPPEEDLEQERAPCVRAFLDRLLEPGAEHLAAP